MTARRAAGPSAKGPKAASKAATKYAAKSAASARLGKAAAKTATKTTQPPRPAKPAAKHSAAPRAPAAPHRPAKSATQPMAASETLFNPELIAAGDVLFRRPWMFRVSVPSLELLPPADRPEVALAGRSNVGKSSLINALVRHGTLAKTSNTPGRTQMLNYFNCDRPLYLVDMPGFGYAEAPKTQVAAWNILVRDYLKGRQTLRRLLLLIDARHGIKPNDEEILTMLDGAAVTTRVILTKADKISPQALVHQVRNTEAALKKHPAAQPQIIVTSSKDDVGLELVRAAIAEVVG